MGDLREYSPVNVDDFQERVGNLPAAAQTFQCAKAIWYGMLQESERQDLGNDLSHAYQCYGRTVGILQKVRGFTRDRAILEAAYNFGLVSWADFSRLDEMVRQNEPAHTSHVSKPNRTRHSKIEVRIEELVRHRNLIVVQGTGRREVYWRGKLIDANWNRSTALWDLLMRLVDAAKLGLGIDPDFGEKPHQLGNLRYRLGSLLPGDFNARIVTGDRYTYILKVLSSEIGIINVEIVHRLDQE